METTVIQIGAIQGVIGIVVAVLAVGIAWGTLKASVKNIDLSIKEIKPDLKDIRERFFTLEGKLSGTFGASSPVSLLQKGQDVLEKSGLKKYIEDNKALFIKKCCDGGTLTNQYDIQIMAFDFFDKLDFGDFEPKLKEASFQYGMGVETLRRIGGIYFRDILLEKYNFKPEDLDKPKASCITNQ